MSEDRDIYIHENGALKGKTNKGLRKKVKLDHQISAKDIAEIIKQKAKKDGIKGYE